MKEKNLKSIKKGIKMKKKVDKASRFKPKTGHKVSNTMNHICPFSIISQKKDKEKRDKLKRRIWRRTKNKANEAKENIWKTKGKEEEVGDEKSERAERMERKQNQSE